MGWRGALRSIEAAERHYAREEARRERAEAKLEALENAQNVVLASEAYIKNIITIHHKFNCAPIDWVSMKEAKPPLKPEQEKARETKAKDKHKKFKPNFFHKLFKTEDKAREKLKWAIAAAILQDEKEYKEKLSKYEEEKREWQETKALAIRIVNSEPEAFLDAVKRCNPFVSIENLGSTINFSVDACGGGDRSHKRLRRRYNSSRKI